MWQLKRICLQIGIVCFILIWGFAFLFPLTQSNPQLDKIPSLDTVTAYPQGKAPNDSKILPNNDSPFLHKGEILVKQESKKVDFLNILKESIPSIVALVVFIGGIMFNRFTSKKQEKGLRRQIKLAERSMEQQRELAIKQINSTVRSGYRQDRMRFFSENLSELLVDAADVSSLLQQKEQNIKEKKEISNDIDEKTKTVLKKLIFHQAKIDLLFYDMGENAQKLNNCISLLFKEAVNGDEFDFNRFNLHCDEIKKLGKLILNDEWGKMIDFQ